jgi:hypothetical protein
MNKQAIPLKQMLAIFAERAAKPKMVARRIEGVEPVKRAIKALMVPEGFVSKPQKAIPSGAQPAKAKINELYQLIREMEKGSSDYLQGFLVKCAQAGVDPKALLQKYLKAVPVNKGLQRKRYEEMITAGKLGIADVGAKSLTDLNPEKLKSMKTWARKNPEAGARISRFVSGKSPYAMWKNPVYSSAFPKAKKGFNTALQDFVASNPGVIRKVIAKYKKPAPKPTPTITPTPKPGK